MNEKLNDELIDLLTRRALYGLEPNESVELDKLLAESDQLDDDSFDVTAAAIGLVDLSIDEPLPEHLHARILASGDEFISSLGQAEVRTEPAVSPQDGAVQKVLEFEPRRRSWNWLGWAIAAVALVALAVNVWTTRTKSPEVVLQPIPTPSVQKPSIEEEFAAMMSSPSSVVKAKWGPSAPTAEIKDVSGDVVWSDQEQKGFMRLKGLPVNDKNRSTYQLWIFDKTQDKATPIDGGTFDVDRNGEVIIPINAKLRAEDPQLFAITIEKPGGVVVSKREKMAALAKVETQSKSSS
jgi:Anti-sigma-K factor rskA